MADHERPPHELIELLASAPPRLAAAAQGVPPALLRAPPAPGEWSASEVLAHLRSCADVWGEAIATIIAQPGATIRAINPTTWIRQTDYPQLDFLPSLQAFAAQREALLATLRALPPEGWSLAATVTGAGRPLRRTVRDYALRLINHERPHIRQIERAARTLSS
ncbi:DinB family protein [Chloroflexia bacterium SDU3-3]|nr:DinB family protein [Chloroflexia bacterium SDU3-3]